MLFLFLETGILGIFLSLDFFLFYVFWEVMLLPMYFLIGIWGGPRHEYAAIKFFLYTLVGSVFILIALLGVLLHRRPRLRRPTAGRRRGRADAGDEPGCPTAGATARGQHVRPDRPARAGKAALQYLGNGRRRHRRSA